MRADAVTVEKHAAVTDIARLMSDSAAARARRELRFTMTPSSASRRAVAPGQCHTRQDAAPDTAKTEHRPVPSMAQKSRTVHGPENPYRP